MPPVCRLGELCTGHGGWPPRPNDQADPTFVINGIAAHAEGMHWVTHCKDDSCHDSVLVSGSPTFRINGLGIARIGDAVACGSLVAQGDPTFVVGD